jgi:hypothetical protein
MQRIRDMEAAPRAKCPGAGGAEDDAMLPFAMVEHALRTDLVLAATGVPIRHVYRALLAMRRRAEAPLLLGTVSPTRDCGGGAHVGDLTPTATAATTTTAATTAATAATAATATTPHVPVPGAYTPACPECGGVDFSHDTTSATLTCVACGVATWAGPTPSYAEYHEANAWPSASAAAACAVGTSKASTAADAARDALQSVEHYGGHLQMSQSAIAGALVHARLALAAGDVKNCGAIVAAALLMERLQLPDVVRRDTVRSLGHVKVRKLTGGEFTCTTCGQRQWSARDARFHCRTIYARKRLKSASWAQRHGTSHAATSTNASSTCTRTHV